MALQFHYYSALVLRAAMFQDMLYHVVPILILKIEMAMAMGEKGL